MTTVLNLRSLLIMRGRFFDRRTRQEIPNAVYIGRRNLHYDLPESPYSNQFTVEQYGRAQCIAMYDAKVSGTPGMKERIRRELKGKTLVCWCLPLTCHGTVLARIADGTD